MATQRNVAQEIAPKMAELSANVLFGDVWERPELSKRDRSLITVAALTALYRTDQLRGHIGRALDNGVTKEEISEVITHMDRQNTIWNNVRILSRKINYRCSFFIYEHGCSDIVC